MKLGSDQNPHKTAKPQGAQIRKRFKFSTVHIEKEIKEIQLKRKSLAVDIANKKWDEARCATPEQQETTRLSAISAHQDALQAADDVDHTLRDFQTWDELQTSKLRKPPQVFHEWKYKIHTPEYQNSLSEDPFGWGGSLLPTPVHASPPKQRKIEKTKDEDKTKIQKTHQIVL